jgi:uncharacterized protein YndB with AHSA1/START domain
MSTFAVTATIHAPPSSVWATLADIGTMAEWNPGVVISRVTSDQAEGEGASRYCQMPGNAFVEERVVEWDPNSRITFRTIDSNLPFKTADVHFRLEPRGSATLVTVTPEYTLQWGPLGWMMDFLMVRRMYRKGMLGLLAGLKLKVERRP